MDFGSPAVRNGVALMRRRFLLKSLSVPMLGGLEAAWLSAQASASTALPRSGGDAAIQSLPALPVQIRPHLGGAAITSADLQLSAFRGSWVYLDFWASWCAPCRISFDWMNRWHQQFASRGVQVVAVGLDQQRQAMEVFLKAQKPAFWVLWDAPGHWARAMQVTVMPTSFLLTPDGRVHSVHKGFSASIAQSIEAQLKATS